MKTANDVLNMLKEKDVKFVDLRFTDTKGKMQHVTADGTCVDDAMFTDGYAFDGSSIAGWKSIEASDMLLMPDPASAHIDPFFAQTTMALFCDVLEPSTGEMYERDPRSIAKKSEAYMQSLGLGDKVYFGPEAEFFIFDHARYDQTSHSGFYYLDSEEGAWNMGQEGINFGGKLRHKQGYFPVAPADTQQDIRSEMVLEMEKIGIEVEKHHHETATGGQAEIDIRFDTLLRTADKMMMYKYIVKNVARRHGKTVTFMPKPLFGDAGSGMHTHQSIWKEGKPLFAGKDYAGISQLCLYYIGGILKHAPALAAFTNPTTNSYKRITPGFEAPVLLAYSSRNRSAGVRIPMYSPSPKAKRIEVRFPDPSCNPYLAFSAMLMAGLDGIQNKINPGEPAEKDLYDLDPKEAASIPTMPGSLDEAMNSLEKDYQFLLKGEVFTEDLVEAWIGYKRSKEIDPLRLRPHPYEFYMYYDV